VTEGPHCPKCGRHDRWEYYAGPNDNPDALRCEAIMITAGISDQCGYIYWRRNAPAGAEVSVDLTAALVIPPLDVAKKRMRVRALVHTLILAPRAMTAPAGIGVVEAAKRIDDEIEFIGAAPGAPPA
jgi:hypothetical protein